MLLQFTVGVGILKGGKGTLLDVRDPFPKFDGLEEDVAGTAEVEDGFDAVEEVGAAWRDDAGWSKG